MKTIHKYVISTNVTCNKISMPMGAKIISAHEQHGEVCIWAIVNTELAMEIRNIVVFGTGQQIIKALNLSFIDTVHLNSGDLVFHVFELFFGHQ